MFFEDIETTFGSSFVDVDIYQSFIFILNFECFHCYTIKIIILMVIYKSYHKRIKATFIFCNGIEILLSMLYDELANFSSLAMFS